VTLERDPYLVLGVARGATDRKIREAYYAQARKAHPDLVGTDGLDAMRLLNEAWALLKDPARRAEYDAAHGVPAAKTGGTSGGAQQGAREPSRKFAGQPAWTGAAGPPPGRPWGHVLESGIYAGWSLGEVARRDRGYLHWLRDKPEGQPHAKEIDVLLAPPPTSEERESARKSGKRQR
jgi:curved DNA-binding protein CbpA